MKIISRKQLMEMPVGTIFSYYEPCIFQGLHSLGGSFGGDFTKQSIFEDKQLFAVYEDEDVKQLINFLVAGRF